MKESFVFSITQKCNLRSISLHWAEPIISFWCRKRTALRVLPTHFFDSTGLIIEIETPELIT